MCCADTNPGGFRVAVQGPGLDAAVQQLRDHLTAGAAAIKQDLAAEAGKGLQQCWPVVRSRVDDGPLARRNACCQSVGITGVAGARKY